MSEFHVLVVEIGDVAKHPNADSLSITEVHGGYPVVFSHVQNPLKKGDKAIYIPIDSVVDTNREEFVFLKKEGKNTHRIKALKLRGIFSMGMLIPCDQSLPTNTNMQEALGITKWEPELTFQIQGESEVDNGYLPEYTDIESYRKYKNVLVEGQEVLITEKIHGSNGRFVYQDNRLWVGSHHQIKRNDPASMWWMIATQYDLENKLKDHEGMAIYGEVYGKVQKGFPYNAAGKIQFVLFDVLNTKTNTYLNTDEFFEFAKNLDIPTVPVLYRGPWSVDCLKYTDGQSTIGNHIREGFVVKPVIEQQEHMGRVILKHISEAYLLKT
jgi:RNA ligase (TIGR02306 family)